MGLGKQNIGQIKNRGHNGHWDTDVVGKGIET